MARSSELVVLDTPWDKELVAGTDSQALVSATPREDFRVRCTSKRAVTEILQLCGRFVQKLGDALPEEIREPVLRDAQWVRAQLANSLLITPYPTPRVLGFRKNPLPGRDRINDSDIKVLEDQFDEIIVDIATKRKQYPRQILECVIKTIKAKQELLKQYHPVVHPLDLKYDPDPVLVEESSVSYNSDFKSKQKNQNLSFG
ncbi:kinetochore-associated protein nsl1 [Saguinus oedipus]|uniref:Kinetochore-associated protein nsl1 n=1 Tax=Saguinus oedipus TaxID=9490 RepID=A0ABQ9TPT8_SAGOE|nr:kinetochore-associated protein nsl1 [Saguinus oedipus]